MDLSKQELVMDEKSIDGDLRSHYTVANSLSRYCAYLIVAKPDLLPDTILVPKLILQKTVSHAREMLKDCDSLQSMYNKLLAVAQEEPSPQDIQDRKLSINLVQRGAILGKKLIEDEHHWELLAKVWVNLLLHIAPSSNAQAHAKYLEFGGEFITLVWALFCHCGIEKSELWQENTTSRISPPGSYQNNNGVAAVAPTPTTQDHVGDGSELLDQRGSWRTLLSSVAYCPIPLLPVALLHMKESTEDGRRTQNETFKAVL
nr:unnamed protein product [Digitaria exilis]